MKDWQAYSNTKAESSKLGGGKPSVLEYMGIKIVDNGLFCVVVIFTLLFAAIGASLQYLKIESAGFFMDMAKLFAGVILGMFAEKRRR